MLCFRGLLVVLVLMFVGCLEHGETVIRYDGSKGAYLCDDYIVEDNSGYSLEDELFYKLKVIQLKGVKEESNIDAVELNNFINSVTNKYDYFFNLSASSVEILPQLINKRVRYTDLLEKYWDTDGYGYVTVIVVPDSVDIVEGNSIGGAASGVPRIHNPSQGKPILFVRRKNSFNNVLIHEIGHILSLLHIFHLNEYTSPGHGCDTHDRVPDTPTPSVGHGISIESCTYYPGVNDKLTEQERKDVVSNFMSYSPPSCMSEFTPSQVNRMKYMSSIHPLLKAAEIKPHVYDLFESIPVDSLQ